MKTNKLITGVKWYMPSLKLFFNAFEKECKHILIILGFWVMSFIMLSMVVYGIFQIIPTENYVSLWEAFLWILDPDVKRVCSPYGFTSGNLLVIMSYLLVVSLDALVLGAFVVIIQDAYKQEVVQFCRNEELGQIENNIRSLFRQYPCPYTKLHIRPRYKSIATIQTRLNISECDILEVVGRTTDLRLRNLATTFSSIDAPQDRLVVELLPPFQKDIYKSDKEEYGCMINRSSRITIVSTSSYMEAGSGSFAYYLALWGGFNYISKEFESNPENPKSFYNVNDCNAMVNKFKTDLDSCIKDKREPIVIFILSTSKKAADINLCYKLTDEAKQEHEISDSISPKKMQKLSKALSKALHIFFKDKEWDYENLTVQCCDSRWKIKANNIALQMRKEKHDLSSFTIRLSWNLSVRDNRHTAVELLLAYLIYKQFNVGCNFSQFCERARKKEEEKIEVSSPQKLQSTYNRTC